MPGTVAVAVTPALTEQTEMVLTNWTNPGRSAGLASRTLPLPLPSATSRPDFGAAQPGGQQVIEQGRWHVDLVLQQRQPSPGMAGNLFSGAIGGDITRPFY